MAGERGGGLLENTGMYKPIGHPEIFGWTSSINVWIASSV